ncbi:MAG: hypothetical protein JRN21_10090 [Nitrososphaerota archaeon]|nr:hypothetical protein [Nitrososphaerota archaeon]
MNQANGSVMGYTYAMPEEWKRLAILDQKYSPKSMLNTWLKRVVADINAPQIVIDETILYFIKGLGVHAVPNNRRGVACALALACRNHEADRVKEIAEIAGVKAMDLTNGMYKLADGLKVTVAATNISRELFHGIQSLGLPQEAYVEVSKHVAAVAKRYPSGIRLRTLFAAVTYGLYSMALTQKQTAEAFGVDEYTLREQWGSKVRPYMETLETSKPQFRD